MFQCLWSTGTVVESRPDEENPTGEFDGWIRVKWDSGVEEDYRFGLDYEFDIEPLKGGMDVVEWPPGKGQALLLGSMVSFHGEGEGGGLFYRDLVLIHSLVNGL